MPLSSDARRMLATLGISAIVHAIALTVIHAAPQTVDSPEPVFARMDDRAPVAVEIFVVEEVAPEPEPLVEATPPEPEPLVEEVPAEPEPETVVERAPEPEPEPVDVETPEAELAAAEAAPMLEEEPEPVEAAVTETDMVAIGSDDAGPELAQGTRGGTTTGTAPTPVAGTGEPDATGTAVAARDGADDGDDALDGLRDRYRRNLERRLARLQNAYSPTLRRLMLEGTVVVVIELDDDGRIVAVNLAGSSGDDRLDEYALSQVRRLGRLVAPPPELGLAARTVELPISYSIQS